MSGLSTFLTNADAKRILSGMSQIPPHYSYKFPAGASCGLASGVEGTDAYMMNLDLLLKFTKA